MFNNLKVSTRLNLLGLIMVLLTMTLVGVGYVMITRVAASLGDVRGTEGNKVLADASDALWELRFGTANYPLAAPEIRSTARPVLGGRPADDRQSQSQHSPRSSVATVATVA